MRVRAQPKLVELDGPLVVQPGLDQVVGEHAYLTEGGVFTDDLIETWLDYKRTVELDELRLRPHPHEFELYYDC